MKKLSLGTKFYLAACAAGFSMSATIALVRYFRHDELLSIGTFLALWAMGILAAAFVALPALLLTSLFLDIKSADEDAPVEERRIWDDEFSKISIIVFCSLIAVCLLFLLGELLGNDYYDPYW